jgi:GR25 family glycosyltransferase involved in LPS biosynthesis
MYIFDSIFCINLKERKDRFKKSKKLFDRLKIPIEYYFADKHNNGRIGCFESHINVIKKSYFRGDNYVLIFEDDIVETSFNENILKDISEYMKYKNCEYFQLGYSILPNELPSYMLSSREMVNNTCILNYVGLLTHSYILSRNGMKKVIDNYESHINTVHLDVFYKNIFKHSSAVVCPTLFQQDFCSKNDNSPPENIYFSILRYLSCFQSNLSLFYLLSVLKRYIFYFIFLISLFILFKYFHV